MKLRIFLAICSQLIFNFSINAELNSSNSFVEWNSGKIQFIKENINIYTTQKDTPTFVTLDIRKDNFDLEKDNILFNLLTDDIRNINGIEIRLMDERNSENFLYYSVPFFTDYEFNLLKSSNKTEISLSRANFKQRNNPIKKINYVTIYFSTKKIGGRLSIWPLEKIKKKSNGILSLTFDDGPDDNILAARILKKYNIPATAYIMPNALNTKGFLTTKELKFLSTQNWDINSHHETPFTYFDKSSLESEIEDIKNFMIKNKYKKEGFHLAYPLGKTNRDTVDIVTSKFSTARIASGGIETIPPANKHMLRSFNVLKTTTPKELREVIAKTKKNKQWLILMFHHIKEKPSIDIDYSTKNFKELSKIINESGIHIMTIDQVYNKFLK